MKNLFGQMGLVDSKPLITYNSGLLLDIATGKYVRGVDDRMILDGGVSSIFGVGGRAKNFKSTILLSYLINVLARYPETHMIIYDVENSVVADKNRVLEMSSLYTDDPTKRAEHINDLDGRVVIVGIDKCKSLEEFDDIILKPLEKQKRSLKNDLTKTVPIIDQKTGELKTTICPTFVVIDSWSAAAYDKIQENIATNGVSDKANNMSYAQENALKGKLFKRFPKLASELGIYFAFTAQINNTVDTNPYAKTPKKIPFMKADTVYKSVGTDYYFFIQTQIGLSSPTPLITNKEASYGLGNNTAASELFSVKNVVESVKGGNGSGMTFSIALSQNYGYNNGITNLEFLKAHDYFSLGTNKINPRCALLPDTVLSRKKAVDELANYKTARALELVSQLCFIQSSWTLNNSVINFNITPEELYEKLNKTSNKIDDVLQSRGWWTWVDSDLDKEREYMSLYDIIKLIS